MKTRHSDGIVFKQDLSRCRENGILIPPLTLQILAENACKHNQYTTESPLVIELACNDNHIQVTNNLQVRKHLEPTSKSGLKNIAERYRLLLDKDIIINQTEHYFQVQIPIINEH